MGKKGTRSLDRRIKVGADRIRPHARLGGAKSAKASLFTHVMRYCDPGEPCKHYESRARQLRDMRCKGHRKERV